MWRYALRSSEEDRDEEREVLEQRSEKANPVVPEGNVIRVPLDAGVEVYVVRDLLKEELKNSIGFGLRNSNDAAGEPYTRNSQSNINPWSTVK